MLELIRICKSFPQRGKVLENLSLKVCQGDSISIMGPSGSGKTTLMNIIGKLDVPDSGEVYFNGKNTGDMDPDESAAYRNRNLGFVFQEHLLLPHLTIRDNILLPLFASKMTREEFDVRESRIMEIAVRMQIGGIMAKYPAQVSGGEAQRATLARALVNMPSVILADEPTGSLDSENAGLLGDLLADMNINSGITLIIATHSATLASKMKKRLILEEGKLR